MSLLNQTGIYHHNFTNRPNSLIRYMNGYKYIYNKENSEFLRVNSFGYYGPK